MRLKACAAAAVMFFSFSSSVSAFSVFNKSKPFQKPVAVEPLPRQEKEPILAARPEQQQTTSQKEQARQDSSSKETTTFKGESFELANNERIILSSEISASVTAVVTNQRLIYVIHGNGENGSGIKEMSGVLSVLDFTENPVVSAALSEYNQFLFLARQNGMLSVFVFQESALDSYDDAEISKAIASCSSFLTCTSGKWTAFVCEDLSSLIWLSAIIRAPDGNRQLLSKVQMPAVSDNTNPDLSGKIKLKSENGACKAYADTMPLIDLPPPLF